MEPVVSLSSKLFWCIVSLSGQTWHRLVIPYTLLPWSLAALVGDIDDEGHGDSKQAIVGFSFKLSTHTHSGLTLKVLCFKALILV